MFFFLLTGRTSPNSAFIKYAYNYKNTLIKIQTPNTLDNNKDSLKISDLFQLTPNVQTSFGVKTAIE